MNVPQEKHCHMNQDFYNFLETEVLPHSSLDSTKFWNDFKQLVADLTPINQALLQTRNTLQNQINNWHIEHRETGFDQKSYTDFLYEIGYITPEVAPFNIETADVDPEISKIAGPQLVVPVNNARFAINAANARWGSLYDVLYGTDVIPLDEGLRPGRTHNVERAKLVYAYSKEFLDQTFPLKTGSHTDAVDYHIVDGKLLVTFQDGTESILVEENQAIGYQGPSILPTSILLIQNELQVEIIFDAEGDNGSVDPAGINDIQIESAVTTIMDFEDAIAAVDAEDKILVYKNWMGLLQGTLESTFTKNGVEINRTINIEKTFKDLHGDEFSISSRSLLIARNVGHLMDTELMLDAEGKYAPEGIIDAVVTALIASINLDNEKAQLKNSQFNSIYIAKPKMHGVEEVEFTCYLFERVEQMLNLAPNTIKLGLMDEERRTTVNLKECIRAAKERIVFINTGLLDRTGDEIHTSMEAGAFLPKEQLIEQNWARAYEQRNVDLGLACGFQGRAQIGKGMWAQPDEMAKLMKEKIKHPQSGANCALVPSPSAATLHALHYHQVNVFDVQTGLQNREMVNFDDLLELPLMRKGHSLSQHNVEVELENNIQGILGYVVRWIEMGIGVSKVLDYHHVGLMEDRSTIRISSQHISNWIHHNICSKQQVENTLRYMALVVDRLNKKTKGYIPMGPNVESSFAYKAAYELIFKGREQPNGYTEPVLHHYRNACKAVARKKNNLNDASYTGD